MYKSYQCNFCEVPQVIEDGVVDIGGLRSCINCYDYKKGIRILPCEVCNRDVKIDRQPLMINTICIDCHVKADLPKAWSDSRNKLPCDKCGKSEDIHHPSIYGQNICHSCYQKKSVCTQLYPGDMGYPAFQTKPFLIVALVPFGSQMNCVVCSKQVDDPAGIVDKFKLPPVCPDCDGPKHWDFFHHRDEVDFWKTYGHTTRIENVV